jgi:hypothetical protein
MSTLSILDSSDDDASLAQPRPGSSPALSVASRKRKRAQYLNTQNLLGGPGILVEGQDDSDESSFPSSDDDNDGSGGGGGGTVPNRTPRKKRKQMERIFQDSDDERQEHRDSAGRTLRDPSSATLRRPVDRSRSRDRSFSRSPSRDTAFWEAQAARETRDQDPDLSAAPGVEIGNVESDEEEGAGSHPVRGPFDRFISRSVSVAREEEGGGKKSDKKIINRMREETLKVLNGVDWTGAEEADISHIKKISLNDGENWGEECPEDDWCFLCSRSDTAAQARNNEYLDDIKSIFENKNKMTRYNMCRIVQRKYNEDFKAFQIDPREWTLRGIRKHAEEHGGMDVDARNRDLQTTFFQLIQKIQRNGLRSKDTRTGETWIIPQGVNNLVRLTTCYIRLVHEGKQ